ncbi:MAG: DUF4227 family protein [Sporolactobacillus sp.]
MKHFIWQASALLKIFFLFGLLTAAFYFGLNWVDYHEQHVHRYDQPGADAVKVGRFSLDPTGYWQNSGRPQRYQRLIEFLRDGE